MTLFILYLIDNCVELPLFGAFFNLSVVRTFLCEATTTRLNMSASFGDTLEFTCHLSYSILTFDSIVSKLSFARYTYLCTGICASFGVDMDMACHIEWFQNGGYALEYVQIAVWRSFYICW